MTTTTTTLSKKDVKNDTHESYRLRDMCLLLLLHLLLSTGGGSGFLLGASFRGGLMGLLLLLLLLLSLLLLVVLMLLGGHCGVLVLLLRGGSGVSGILGAKLGNNFEVEFALVVRLFELVLELTHFTLQYTTIRENTSKGVYLEGKKLQVANNAFSDQIALATSVSSA